MLKIDNNNDLKIFKDLKAHCRIPAFAFQSTFKVEGDRLFLYRLRISDAILTTPSQLQKRKPDNNDNLKKMLFL
jgi:hypothetical protein